MCVAMLPHTDRSTDVSQGIAAQMQTTIAAHWTTERKRRLVPIELRQYQKDAIAETRKHIVGGSRSPLLVAPTGSGKTVLLAEIVRLHLNADTAHKALVVAHRRELIGQITNTLLRMKVGAIGEIHPDARPHYNARVNVASTQTLRARKMVPHATLLIFDEAHHYSSDDWHELTKSYPNVVRIGFTATPMRSDGRGMAPAFSSLVVVSTIKKLTEQGYLVPCRVIAPEAPLRRPNLACQPVEAYQRLALGKRTVVFAEFVADALTFRNQFLSAGIKACVITGSMSQEDRKGALAEHAAGSVLINVMVLTEGWDSAETECCILARGCGSVGTYLQIVGRVLRPYPGKSEALLIDLRGSSFHSHGAPDLDREYSLEGKGIATKEDSDVVFCSVCGAPAPEWPCADCGYDPTGTRHEDPRYLDVDLAERYAAKRVEDDGRRIETLSRWLSEARAKRWKPFSAIAKYTQVYGMKPSNEAIAIATEMSRSVQCRECIRCGKPAAKTYKGGQCGKCAFEARS